MKSRYSIRVQRDGKTLGEFRFNATPEGLRQLIANIKPEFQYDISSDNGIIHNHGYRIV